MSEAITTDRARRRQITFCLFIFIVAVALRFPILDRQTLWADEIFSLAMATGHSLEHPASRAQSELGDYIEAKQALPAIEYQKYLQHQEPPVGPAQVIRAVGLSDTSPPLYYLLLWAWIRIVGTSDVAVRIWSVFWALACLPLFWLVAKEIGGKPAIIPALVLFTFAPLSIYYSTEGRMYSLLWFLALGLIWLTLKLNQHGPRPFLGILWIFIGTAGMLTHYFYAFVLLACGGWLLLHPGRLNRMVLLAACAGIGVLIVPWYVQIAESLSLWRVTKDWLSVPTVSSRLTAALQLPWSFVSPSSRWWQQDPVTDYLAIMIFLLLVVVGIGKLGKRLWSKRRQLMWLWLFLTCAGLFAFDKIMGTYTTAVPRYAIAGMPAVLLLLALFLSRLRLALQTVLLLAIVMIWLPSIWTIVTNSVRGWQPFRQIAWLLGQRVTYDDVVVVHSIPSGVLGIARYVQRPMNLYSWVGQLKQRHVPDDIEPLAVHHQKIVLIKIHTVGEPAPEEAWLREHVRLTDEMKIGNAEVLFFVRQHDQLPPADKALRH